MGKNINKSLTLSTYLKDIEDSNLFSLLVACSLENVSVKLFFKYFDKVIQTPDEVAKFIKDPNNGFELSMFGHRASGKMKYNAYNGLGHYQGIKCTVGVRHSGYHG